MNTKKMIFKLKEGNKIAFNLSHSDSLERL